MAHQNRLHPVGEMGRQDNEGLHEGCGEGEASNPGNWLHPAPEFTLNHQHGAEGRDGGCHGGAGTRRSGHPTTAVTWAARLVRVLSAVALVPSAPVMIAELAGAAATETADLRVAAVSAARGLPPRWVGVGVASEDAVVSPDAVGTFAGYGVDLPVALSAAALGGQPARLPLCVLVAAWLRGTANPAASAEMRYMAKPCSVCTTSVPGPA